MGRKAAKPDRSARVRTAKKSNSPLAGRLDRLEKLYGPPASPPTRDPFALVLWENVAYLVSDEKRAAAFRELKRRVGLTPREILAAPKQTLYEIASVGRMPELRVGVLRSCAEVAITQCGGDVSDVVSRPAKEALRVLKKFPGIGEPGAEKILLFSGAQPLFALESNGLRVLVRLGYAEEQKSYSTTYRMVREAVAEEIVHEVAWLTRAHSLLKRHGQEICKRSAPLCEACPLQSGCALFEAS